MAETHVRQLLAAQGADVVWLDVMAKALPRVAPTGQVDLTTDFFINDQGYPVVSDGHQPEGQQWVTVSDYRSFGTDEWVRVTIKFDYAAQESQFYLEGKLLADGLGFMSPAQSFACVSFRGEGGFVDDIVVSTNEPAGLSLDTDNLPDDWEIENFGDVSQTDEDDPDGDGLSNIEEYQLGTDPADFDSDGDGVSDGSEVELVIELLHHAAEIIQPGTDVYLGVIRVLAVLYQRAVSEQAVRLCHRLGHELHDTHGTLW